MGSKLLHAGLVALTAVTVACGGSVMTSNADAGTSGSSCGDTIGPTPTGVCDLSLVASGELPRRDDWSVDRLAVAASATEFTIAYVETDPGFMHYDGTLVDLCDSGQLGTVVRNDLPSCNSKNARGAAVAYDPQSGAGLAAFATPNCGGSGAEAMFVALSSSGTPTAPKLATKPGFYSMAFGPHALAPIGKNRFAFVFGNRLATLTGSQFDGPEETLSDGGVASYAAISTDQDVQGLLLAEGNSGRLMIGQPGVDTGSDFSVLLGGPWGLKWGAVAVIGNSVGVLLPAQGPEGLDFALYSDNAKTISVPSGSLGELSSTADLAALGNRLIIVTASDNELEAYRIDNPTGTPAPKLQAVNKLTAKVQAGLLAIAAARRRVAVVYSAPGTPGYWALLSCG